jgi:hypothetical protein
MLCGTRLAITEFAPSYKRGAVMQASLAAVGTLAAIAAWLLGAPAPWLIGGLTRHVDYFGVACHPPAIFS